MILLLYSPYLKSNFSNIAHFALYTVNLIFQFRAKMAKMNSKKVYARKNSYPLGISKQVLLQKYLKMPLTG